MKCKICGNPLEQKLVYENMPSGAQTLLTKETLSSDKGISLPICQCVRCGLVQIPVKPVKYYRKSIRTGAWMRPEWRKKQLAEFKDEFKLHGKKIVSITEEPKAASYDAFLIFNYLEHFPDPMKILRRLCDNLPPGGVGIVDVPNFEMMAKEKVFSELVIDHLFYFTRPTLAMALVASGFEVVRMTDLLDGYILSATVRKRREADFAADFREQQAKLTQSLERYLARHSSVSVWGAGHQTFFLLSMLKNVSKIPYVIDSSHLKQGKYTPVTHIPIEPPEVLKSRPVEAIIVMVGGFYYEVPAQIKALGLQYSPELSIIKKTELEKL